MGTSPRPFQERVFKQVLNGKNVVLQAPTGSGKTRAALEPFIANLAEPGKHDLPRTCRYAVPLRTLANQFYTEHEALTEKMKKSNHHLEDLMRRYDGVHAPVPFVAEQTGEVSQDPKFEAALTFCTIDQLLAAALEEPYGVGPGQTNLKVAGVLGSYLVLDEWHLYPPQARTALLALLRWLGKYDLARFVVMTATLSTTLVQQLAELLNAESETLRQGRKEDNGETAEEAFRREYQEIAAGRARTMRYEDGVLEDHLDTILERHHTHGRTLIVCNKPERAQAVYLRLTEEKRRGRTDADLIVLHSRFIGSDRAPISDRLVELLGKNAWERRKNGEGEQPNVIVVATQVVEVGLNISAIDVHTELAPANSLVQRAGRGARFDGEHGHVTVYAVPPAANSRAQYLPYDARQCEDTRAALPAEARPFDYADEQKLIDAVHTKEDERFLDEFLQQEGECRRRIWGCWNWQDSHRGDVAGEMIRDVREVPVLIHDDPDAEIIADPWRWQSFGLHPDTVRSRFEPLQRLAAEKGCDWAMKHAVLLEPERDADGRTRTPCKWDCVPNADVAARALFLVLPTALAHYDAEIGFALRDSQRVPGIEERASKWPSEDVEPRRRPERKPTERQSIGIHVSRLTCAYTWSLNSELAWLTQRLEDLCKYPRGTIDRAIRLAIATHDLGKLTEDWQHWAIAFMNALHRLAASEYDAPVEDVLWGKTDIEVDFRSERYKVYKEAERQLHAEGIERPHHAVESVKLGSTLTWRLMGQLLPDEKERRLLSKAAHTAIAHHHTRSASSYNEAHLVPGAAAAMTDILRKAVWSDVPAALVVDTLQPKGKPRSTGVKDDASAYLLSFGADFDEDVTPEDPLLLWVYFTLVRALRLADHRADSFHDIVPSKRAGER